MFEERPTYASESVSLITDFVPTINVQEIRSSSAGNLMVHFIGDAATRAARIEFALPPNSAQGMHIDKIFKLNTTIAAADLLLLGLPKIVGLQKVFGNLYRNGSNPSVGTLVTANVDAYFSRESVRLKNQQILSAVTDAAGYFELYLIYGSRALITALNREEVYLSRWVTVKPALECNIDCY